MVLNSGVGATFKLNSCSTYLDLIYDPSHLNACHRKEGEANSISLETATRKAKAAVGIESEDAKAKTAKFTAKAKDTAREVAGEAREKADDAAAEAKKRLGETKGKL